MTSGMAASRRTPVRYQEISKTKQIYKEHQRAEFNDESRSTSLRTIVMGYG
jgi:hypothetical protein